LSGQKRKSFTFDEEDMEWINPLILEWVKENEGKNQSDFMKELMTGYKARREGAPEEEAPIGRALPSVEGIKDYMERIPLGATRDELGSRLEGLSDTVKSEYGKLSTKVRELEAGARLRKALQDFSRELRPRLEGLLDAIKRKIKDLTDEIKKLQTRRQ
jgi:phage-related minor tail protein